MPFYITNPVVHVVGLYKYLFLLTNESSITLITLIVTVKHLYIYEDRVNCCIGPAEGQEPIKFIAIMFVSKFAGKGRVVWETIIFVISA